MSSLKDYLSANPPSAPGAGTYSTDGTLTSGSSNAGSSLNRLA
jgi:hypothetical protein